MSCICLLSSLVNFLFHLIEYCLKQFFSQRRFVLTELFNLAYLSGNVLVLPTSMSSDLAWVGILLVHSLEPFGRSCWKLQFGITWHSPMGKHLPLERGKEKRAASLGKVWVQGRSWSRKLDLLTRLSHVLRVPKNRQSYFTHPLVLDETQAPGPGPKKSRPVRGKVSQRRE